MWYLDISMYLTVYIQSSQCISTGFQQQFFCEWVLKGDVSIINWLVFWNPTLAPDVSWDISRSTRPRILALIIHWLSWYTRPLYCAHFVSVGPCASNVTHASERMPETRPICFGEPIQLQHFRTDSTRWRSKLLQLTWTLRHSAQHLQNWKHTKQADKTFVVNKLEALIDLHSPGFLGLWRCINRVPSRTQRYVRVRAKAPASLQAAARLVELQAGSLEQMPFSRLHDMWHVVGKVHRRCWTALGYGFWSFIVVIGNHWHASHGLKSRSSWARHGSST